jgi:hypothetical protein
MVAFAWMFIDEMLKGNMIPGRERYAMMMGGMILGGLVLSIYLIAKELKCMPFRVYERGITVIEVPVMSGLFRREILVPEERIVSVRMRNNVSGTHKIHSIIVKYTEEDGTAQVLEVDTEDPLSVLMALEKVVSDRVDDGARELLDPERASEEVVQEGKTSRSPYEPIPYLSLFLLAGIGFIIALLLYRFSNISEKSGVSLHLVVVSTIAIGVFYAMGHFTARNAYPSLFDGPNVRAKEDGLEVQVPFVLRLLVRAPMRLPYDRVRRARRYIRGRSFRPMYQMLAGWGGPISISSSLFREIAHRPEFERRGFELVNTGTPSQESEPLVRVNVLNMIGLITMSTVVFFLVLNVFNPIGGDGVTNEGEDEPAMMPWFFIDLVFFVFIPLVFLFTIFMFLRIFWRDGVERRAVGIEIDRTAIRLPRAQGPFSELSRSDIGTITARRVFTLGRVALVVETAKGRLLLPNYVRDDLIDKGYHVEVMETQGVSNRLFRLGKGA